jgi:Uma2 family endonuclease
LSVYARHGVSEVWIEDLTTDSLLVFREPSGATYKTQLGLQHAMSIAPLAFPDLVLSVSELLGLDPE